jgi:hypothetical protein
VQDLFHRVRESAGITDVRCSPHTFRPTLLHQVPGAGWGACQARARWATAWSQHH